MFLSNISSNNFSPEQRSHTVHDSIGERSAVHNNIM